MPKKLEAKLERSADKKGLTGDRRNAYVYGTMARIESHKRPSRHSKHGRRSKS